MYIFMKVSLSPDIILCGWLGLKHQLPNLPPTGRRGQKTNKRGVCFNMFCYFSFNLESFLHSWCLAGLSVGNTTTVIAASGSLWPPWSCPFGDVSVKLLCPISKRWCVQHGLAGTLVVALRSLSRWLLWTKVRFEIQSTHNATFWN